MDFEQLIADIGIQNLQLFIGLSMGLVFGVGAALSQFCLRKLVLELLVLKFSSASYTWLLGLSAALLFTQLLLQGDASDISEAQVIRGEASLSGPIIGGLMFGFGMMLSRGCASRQIIVLASGNLRPLLTLFAFALSAQLAYGGQLVSFRRGIQDLWRLDQTSSQLPGWLPLAQSYYMLIAFAFAVAVASGVVLIKGRAWPQLLGATIVGLAVALGWFATSFVAYHSFNSILPQSITFSAPAAQSVISVMSLDAPFIRLGAGILLGCLVGSLLVTFVRQDFHLQGFTSQSPMGRYLLAGMLMGVGSVLANGCSVGAGLSGTAIMATSSIVTLICIIIGGLVSARYSS